MSGRGSQPCREHSGEAGRVGMLCHPCGLICTPQIALTLPVLPHCPRQGVSPSHWVSEGQSSRVLVPQLQVTGQGWKREDHSQ